MNEYILDRSVINSRPFLFRFVFHFHGKNRNISTISWKSTQTFIQLYIHVCVCVSMWFAYLNYSSCKDPKQKHIYYLLHKVVTTAFFVLHFLDSVLHCHILCRDNLLNFSFATFHSHSHRQECDFWESQQQFYKWNIMELYHAREITTEKFPTQLTHLIRNLVRQI